MKNCLLLVVLCLTTTTTIGQELEPVRIHGLIEVSSQGETHQYPGYLEFSNNNLLFAVVWGWPNGVELPSGRQSVTLYYHAYPSVSVIFQNKLSVAVIPSDEGWRHVCRLFNGFREERICVVYSHTFLTTYWRGKGVAPTVIYFQYIDGEQP